MAKTITFDTGIVEYEINGAATVRFNPADEDFARKLYAMVDDLEAKQAEFERDEPSRDAFERFGELDAEMRASIDDLLGDGVADSLFPNMNCYAMADGLPVWMNLVMALADEVADAYVAERGKTDGRLSAHSRKYDEMMAKYGRGDKGKKKGRK